jgi:chromosome segregation protein
LKFAKLRLSGFKSFADPTELVIQQGLTGVVGPNGCGKSNLLEALRWVMGEASYKSMRGSGMEDVIFAGSKGRPGRNMAEVALFLENQDRKAPAAYNDHDQIEVARRIQHEAGSAYRINGKEVRAKDVQLMFADASTGAHSPALVRQGQIGEMINAKPTDRRKILEEAAGITGLHSRRHEAQLRLNGAETNLTRLDDVIGQMEAQLAGLKRQARQATRYKNVSAEIRKLEAMGVYLRWREADRAATEAAEELDRLKRELAEKTQASAEARRLETEAAERLPGLRQAEAEAAAGLQRIAAEVQRLDAQAQHAEERAREISGRLEQCAQDKQRETSLIEDAKRHLERLSGEAETLEGQQAGASAAEPAARAELDKAQAVLKDAEQVLDDALQSIAQLNARRAAHERVVEQQSLRADKLARELAEIEQAQGELGEQAEDAGFVEAANALAEAEQELASAEQDLVAAERTLASSRTTLEEARSFNEDRQSAKQDIETEIRTLAKLLNVNDGGLWPPVIDALKVDPGYEKALGAALGEDLDAPLDEAAPVHWREMATGDTPELPGGVEPLSQFVQAPDALRARLDQIGVVAQAQGPALQKQLAMGQRLVSEAGDLWRWDGFSAAAEAETPAAKRLAERNRLGELEMHADEIRNKADEAAGRFEQAAEELHLAETSEQTARAQWRSTNEIVNQCREAKALIEQGLGAKAQRRAALGEAAARLNADKADCDAALATAQAELEKFSGDAPGDEDLARLRDLVEQHRAGFAEARAAHDGLAHQAQARTARLEAVGRDRASWQTRSAEAGAQIETLQARERGLEEERRKLAELPNEIEAGRRRLLDARSEAETGRKQAADTLAHAESELAALAKTLREREAEFGDTRETLARIETRLEADRTRTAEFSQQINEALGVGPTEVPEVAGFDGDDDLPDTEALDARLRKLQGERERLGAVNLRAEEEAREITEQRDGLVRERDDLIKAIHRLRHGIGQLNKDGRKRLLDAFDTVDENFQRLFTHLFGGGEAKLELVEADDPLEAGLEIFARPPGKRRQALSLLSGGEQALTALSLIFAVFLTNPSPICVLDEVDAPLDDANVQRFCNLIDEMTRTTDTRYLIITHHPYTMSRMDRLFGVTMSERGVSQLVSVDLETAERYREAG